MPKNKLESTLLSKIRSFAGNIDAEQLCFVESFVANQVVMFMPIAGPCMMAISPLHSHPCPLFVVNFTDTSYIVFSNKKIRSKANTVTYIPAHLPHHEVNETDIPRYVAIMVQSNFVDEHAKEYHSTQFDWSVPFTFSLSDDLLSSIKRFIGEYKLPKEGSEKVLEAYSIETTHQLLRSMFGIKSKNCTQVSRIEINRCIEYMRQNLSEKLNLSSLACLSGMSVSQFTRVFRQETSLSPIDFLIEMRLEVASHLILGDQIPLKKIAMDCGFSSHAHFSSSFQKKYKMSPSEYLRISR